jgi:hypothetical protein
MSKMPKRDEPRDDTTESFERKEKESYRYG